MNAPLSLLQPQLLYLRPRTICAGIGCKRNMEQKPIEEALLQTFKRSGPPPSFSKMHCDDSSEI